MRFQNRVCLLTSIPKKKGKKRKRQKNVWPTLDADAHIFRAASSFWTRKGASDAASPGRRPCAERRGRRAEDQEKKKLTRPGIEPGSAPWQGAILPLDQRVLRSGLSVNSEAPTSRSYPISKTGAMSNHPFPSGLFDVYESESSNYVPCFFPEYTGYYSTIGHGP